jgi:hypothetical protein
MIEANGEPGTKQAGTTDIHWETERDDDHQRS